MRNRFGPGTMLAVAYPGTSRGDSSDRESTVTSVGSNGTISHTRNTPPESVVALVEATRIRTLGSSRSPGS